MFVKEYATGSTRYMTQLWAKDGGRFLKEVDEYGVLGKVLDVNVSVGESI